MRIVITQHMHDHPTLIVNPAQWHHLYTVQHHNLVIH
jgi:hypothetical protein